MSASKWNRASFSLQRAEEEHDVSSITTLRSSADCGPPMWPSAFEPGSCLHAHCFYPYFVQKKADLQNSIC